MSSILKTDKIENLSGKTIASYDSNLGWIHGTNSSYDSSHHANHVVKTNIFKKTLSKDIITENFGHEIEGQEDRWGGWPGFLLSFPTITLSSTSNSVLLKCSFTPLIENNPRTSLNHPVQGGVGMWGRYYICNSSTYNINADVTSQRPIYDTDLGIAYAVGKQGDVNVHSDVNRWLNAATTGKGIPVGWFTNQYYDTTMILPTRTFTAMENSNSIYSLYRTYSFFALAGNYFGSNITNPPQSSGNDRPYNPNHKVGLPQDSIITLVAMEIQSSTIGIEQYQ